MMGGLTEDSIVSDLLGNHIVGFLMRGLISCTPDREILRFTPCEKLLSHPCYLTPVATCIQMFFFNIGCIGRHVISSLSAYITMISKRFNSKWQTLRIIRDCRIFLCKYNENQASPH